MPVSTWARVEHGNGSNGEPTAKEDYLQLLSGLRIPQQVAVISYPRGCRIRRVRVRALDENGEPVPAPAASGKKPLIVSKRKLQQSRRSATR
jgi:hypothetical protein